MRHLLTASMAALGMLAAVTQASAWTGHRVHRPLVHHGIRAPAAYAYASGFLGFGQPWGAAYPGYGAYGYAAHPDQGAMRRRIGDLGSRNGFGQEPGNMLIQDRDMRRSD